MTSSITVEPYETVEQFSDSDTDSWQVVDPFDSENDDVITSESEDEDVVVDDVIPTESDVISSEDDVNDDDDEDDVISSEDAVNDEDDDDDDEDEDEDEDEEEEDEEEDDDDDVITPMSSDEITSHTQELNKAAVEFEGPYNVEISDVMREDAYWECMRLERMLDEVEEEDEEDDDYDEEDLDDELIPRWLNNKFERQRMRKLGKKVYPKMKKSKRMVNQYNRPGCAGAKHGLGLKHNLI